MNPTTNESTSDKTDSVSLDATWTEVSEIPFKLDEPALTDKIASDRTERISLEYMRELSNGGDPIWARVREISFKPEFDEPVLTLADKIAQLKTDDLSDIEIEVLDVLLSSRGIMMTLGGQLSLNHPDMKFREIKKMVTDCGFKL